MRLRFRLFLIWVSSFWKKPMEALDESVLDLRVLPNDVDIIKISDDRYIALMDLGRMDIVFRMGLLKSMLKNNWAPLVTFANIRFRYPLKIFQKYQLKTSIVWWDDTTFYLKQVFERKGRVVATGYVYATFLRSSGPVPPDEILAETGRSVTKPDEPEIAAKMSAVESLIHETQKE